MNLDKESIDLYVKRLRKRNSDEPLSKPTQSGYRTVMKKLVDAKAIQKALHPDEFLSILASLPQSPGTTTQFIKVTIKFLSSLSNDELAKHYPEESDLSFAKINQVVSRYRNALSRRIS